MKTRGSQIPAKIKVAKNEDPPQNSFFNNIQQNNYLLKGVL